MASCTLMAIILMSFAIIALMRMPNSVTADDGCGEECSSDDDCEGELFCNKNGKCADDPDVGSNICSDSPNGSDDDSDNDSDDDSDDDSGHSDDDSDNDSDNDSDDDSDDDSGDSDTNGCGQACHDYNDCEGELICISKKCTDDPEVGTHTCSSSSNAGDSGDDSDDDSGKSDDDSGDSGDDSDDDSGKSGDDSGDSTCKSSGTLHGTSHSCNKEYDSDCCKSGTEYPQYKCSPPVTDKTPAKLTINSFEKGGDGGSQSACDGQYHSNNDLLVALSTGWFENGKRCKNSITITANGKSVKAQVIDECDSVQGCDDEHDNQPPCHNNIVDASSAVWRALGIPKGDWGDYDVTWSDS